MANENKEDTVVIDEALERTGENCIQTQKHKYIHRKMENYIYVPHDVRSIVQSIFIKFFGF